MDQRDRGDENDAKTLPSLNRVWRPEDVANCPHDRVYAELNGIRYCAYCGYVGK